jgi:anti-anti-sigma regulatory factor
MDELAGVCIDDVHYYDFKNVQYINNTGMASLIDLLKCLLEQGMKVQFVNVNEKIKSKIKLLGLENILNCS